ncbi:MAG: hypothetical protein ACI90V_002053 [Bacillariaceae sp.]|jgi:hypothetical protein
MIFISFFGGNIGIDSPSSVKNYTNKETAHTRYEIANRKNRNTCRLLLKCTHHPSSSLRSSLSYIYHPSNSVRAATGTSSSIYCSSSIIAIISIYYPSSSVRLATDRSIFCLIAKLLSGIDTDLAPEVGESLSHRSWDTRRNRQIYSS